MGTEFKENRPIDLCERSQEILRAIVRAYLKSAEPVGSRIVAKRTGLGLSPATIRNAMADLEEIGLLFQPHTSAGRMPTEEGLRYYVDRLLERESLSWGDQLAIEQGLIGGIEDLGVLLKKAVQVLAQFTGHVAVVSAPRASSSHLRHIEFVRVRPGVILVVSIYDSGIVQNRVVRIERDLVEDQLESLAEYVNAKLAGMTLEQVRSRVIEDMEEERRLFALLFDEVFPDGRKREDSGEIFVGGQVNLLGQPEFSNIGRLRALLQTLEEKKTLVTLLDRCFEGQGVQILIGSKGVGQDLSGCGVVLAPYASSEHPFGSLGVVGPMRMDYGRVAALVEYTAKVLSEKVEESE